MGNVSRTALSLGVAALLAGCSGSQPPIGAANAASQSRAIGTHAGRGTSWMLPEAKSEDLIYLADEYSVLVYTYAGKEVGDVEHLISPGVCSDSLGDVWITSQGQVTEYVHGVSTPNRVLDTPLTAISCTVNPSTNDLAVTMSQEGNPSEVAIYRNASGTPQTYADSNGIDFKYCSYDNNGNLYVEGRRGHGEALVEELPNGGSSLATLKLGKKLAGPGGVQWDGTYLALGDDRNNVIYQVAVTSGYGTIENTIHLSTWERHQDYQFWIHNGVVGLMYSRKYFGFWDYPGGGRKIHKFIYDFGTTGGNALSLAP